MSRKRRKKSPHGEETRRETIEQYSVWMCEWVCHTRNELRSLYWYIQTYQCLTRYVCCNVHQPIMWMKLNIVNILPCRCCICKTFYLIVFKTHHVISCVYWYLRTFIHLSLSLCCVWSIFVQRSMRMGLTYRQFVTYFFIYFISVAIISDYIYFLNISYRIDGLD